MKIGKTNKLGETDPPKKKTTGTHATGAKFTKEEEEARAALDSMKTGFSKEDRVKVEMLIKKQQLDGKSLPEIAEGMKATFQKMEEGGKLKQYMSKGGKLETDPPKKELTAQQERFIKDLAGKELDAWMNKEKDQTYGHNSTGRVNMFTGAQQTSYSYKKGQNVGETKRKFIENQGGREAYIESLIKEPKYRARLEKKLPDYGMPAKKITPNIKIKKAK
tara:strand:- start:84 stop:740 length:657 start_codon:yes stop_codon:yes gene_type:complete